MLDMLRDDNWVTSYHLLTFARYFELLYNLDTIRQIKMLATLLPICCQVIKKYNKNNTTNSINTKTEN